MRARAAARTTESAPPDTGDEALNEAAAVPALVAAAAPAFADAIAAAASPASPPASAGARPPSISCRVMASCRDEADSAHPARTATPVTHDQRWPHQAGSARCDAATATSMASSRLTDNGGPAECTSDPQAADRAADRVSDPPTDEPPRPAVASPSQSPSLSKRDPARTIARVAKFNSAAPEPMEAHEDPASAAAPTRPPCDEAKPMPGLGSESELASESEWGADEYVVSPGLETDPVILPISLELATEPVLDPMAAHAKAAAAAALAANGIPGPPTAMEMAVDICCA